jgi:hypothetical protein
LSKFEQIDSAKFGDSATFSSVAKAQARHLAARDAAKKRCARACAGPITGRCSTLWEIAEIFF